MYYFELKKGISPSRKQSIYFHLMGFHRNITKFLLRDPTLNRIKNISDLH